jgi:hypothetical protein
MLLNSLLLTYFHHSLVSTYKLYSWDGVLDQLSYVKLPLRARWFATESRHLSAALPFICMVIATVMVCAAVVSKTGHWNPWVLLRRSLCWLMEYSCMRLMRETSGARGVGLYSSILIGSGDPERVFNCRAFQRNPGTGFVEPRMIPAAVGLITCAQLTTPAVMLSSQTLSS